MDMSLWEILQSHFAMWAILAASVLAVAVGLERLIVYWGFAGRARTLAETVNRCLTRGALDEGRSACERSQSPLADVFLVGYERLGRVKKSALAAAVNRERLRVAASLKSHLWMLATIGALAPFIGLFGTVIGIIDAMSAIGETTQAGFNVVSGPVALALYATAFGIGVGIVAVTIYNYFNQRLSRMAVELRMYTEEFLELLDEHDPRLSATAPEEGTKDKQADGARDAA